MPADAPTDSLPDPSPLTAYLVASPAADAIAFYAEAFGAEEILRFEDPSGLIMHAQLRLNGADLMLSDEMEQMGALAPQRLGGSPASLHLYTEDADAAFEKAVAAGAKALRAPSDQFHGDRSGQVEDPFGYRWHIASRKETLTRAEIAKRWADMMGGA